jgi:type IV pilus assembly protein PilA
VVARNLDFSLRKDIKRMRNRQKGFSLIELLIVVAIILIIAAIAIPNLLRAKIAANEASAVSSLRTMNTADITYNSTYGNYSPDFGSMGPSLGATPTSTDADLLDDILGCNGATAPCGAGTVTVTKSGYTFTYTNGTPTGGYNIVAGPVGLNVTGVRYFYTDNVGVIYYNNGAAASSANSPLGGTTN